MPDILKKPRGDDPRFSEPKLRNDCRRLDLSRGAGKPTEIWQWKVGRNVVVLYGPDDQRHDVPLWAVLEMDKSEWSYASDEIPITPADVTSYIKRCIWKASAALRY